MVTNDSLVKRKMESFDYIGLRLKQERGRLGFTQAEFASIGEVTRQSQAKYEKGLRFPDAVYLSRLSRAGLNVDFVLSNDGSASDLTSSPAIAEDLENFLITDSYANSDADNPSRTQRPTFTTKVGRDELKWLEWYRLIEEDDRDMVESIVQGFAERGQKKQSQTG